MVQNASHRSRIGRYLSVLASTPGISFHCRIKEGTMFGLIWWIIVGLIAGWLTGKIMSGGGYGPLMDIIIGIIGALAGGFIMSRLGFAGSGGLIYTIIVAVIGAVILDPVTSPGHSRTCSTDLITAGHQPERRKPNNEPALCGAGSLCLRKPCHRRKTRCSFS